MFQDQKLNNGFERLKQQFEENPVLVIGVTAGIITAVAKLIDAVSSAQGRRAYAKQINYKTKKGVRGI